MKKLLFILAIICSSSITIMYAQKIDNNSTRINLYHQQRETPIDKEDASVRSIPIQAAYAYINNNVISIYFEQIPDASTIRITNVSSGETVYTETYSTPTNLCIDMNGENSGNYQIIIETETFLLEGNFSR